MLATHDDRKLAWNLRQMNKTAPHTIRKRDKSWSRISKLLMDICSKCALTKKTSIDPNQRTTMSNVMKKLDPRRD